MTKNELEAWALEHFWPRYTGLMKTPFANKWKGGARGDAVKKILTLNPSEQTRRDILDAIEAQGIYRSKKWDALKRNKDKWQEYVKAEKVLQNRMASTWINQYGWKDEIPSLTEDAEEQEKISTCLWCINEVAYRNTLCRACEKKYRQGDRKMHAQNLAKMGLFFHGDSLETIAKRCKEAWPQLKERLKEKFV